MRVKICGITSPDDAKTAADAGADAIGLNFVSGPRRIDPQRGAEILAELPPLITPVVLVEMIEGRFADPPLELLRRFRVSHVQSYGQVTPDVVASLRGEGLRAILVQRVKANDFPASTQEFLDQCGSSKPSAVLLDAYDAGVSGGTGKTIDWRRIAEARDNGDLEGWPPIILAGGLTPENVAEAVAVVQPWGVDVSSGVEDSPGRKSAEKMRAFIRAARSVE